MLIPISQYDLNLHQAADAIAHALTQHQCGDQKEGSQTTPSKIAHYKHEMNLSL